MVYLLNLDNYNLYKGDISNLLSELIEDEIRLEKQLNNLKEYIENKSTIIGVHISDNKVISLVWSYEREFGGEKRLHVPYIIVLESYRGLNLSKELLDFVEKQAVMRNITKIDLNVDLENEKAIKVYENTGFKPEKIQYVKDVNINEGC